MKRHTYVIFVFAVLSCIVLTGSSLDQGGQTRAPATFIEEFEFPDVKSASVDETIYRPTLFTSGDVMTANASIDSPRMDLSGAEKLVATFMAPGIGETLDGISYTIFFGPMVSPDGSTMSFTATSSEGETGTLAGAITVVEVQVRAEETFVRVRNGTNMTKKVRGTLYAVR